jgi:hypothetical protein
MDGCSSLKYRQLRIADEFRTVACPNQQYNRAQNCMKHEIQDAGDGEVLMPRRF